MTCASAAGKNAFGSGSQSRNFPNLAGALALFSHLHCILFKFTSAPSDDILTSHLPFKFPPHVHNHKSIVQQLFGVKLVLYYCAYKSVNCSQGLALSFYKVQAGSSIKILSRLTELSFARQGLIRFLPWESTDCTVNIGWPSYWFSGTVFEW